MQAEPHITQIENIEWTNKIIQFSERNISQIGEFQVFV